MSPVAKHTFDGWMTGSLHHNVTGMFCSSLVKHSVICVLMRHECWTCQGCLSCSPWQCFCHNWTATDATHSPWQSVCHNWTGRDATHSCMPVYHAAHDSLFTTTEQLQMPHTAACQSLMQPLLKKSISENSPFKGWSITLHFLWVGAIFHRSQFPGGLRPLACWDCGFEGFVSGVCSESYC